MREKVEENEKRGRGWRKEKKNRNPKKVAIFF
jgi:hypothetical protein